MCLIIFTLQAHPHYPFVAIANRDERYDRPTAHADFWPDHPHILAGRDLLKNGTWLGITKDFRFSAITNAKKDEDDQPYQTSRGDLVRDFLGQNIEPEDYIQNIHRQHEQYDGFNLLVGSLQELYYYNNITNDMQRLTKGIHAVSNHLLNTPWPKIIKGKKRLGEYLSRISTIDPNELFQILADTEVAPDNNLPINRGLSIEMERQLSPLFIQTPHYGTKCSTVIFVDVQNNVTFIERTFDQGKQVYEQEFTFQRDLEGKFN